MYLLKDNETNILKTKQVPLGAKVYVLYENTYLSKAAQTSFVAEGGADTSDLNESSDLFNTQYTKTAIEVFEDIPYDEAALQEFLAEKVTFYVGDTSEKMQIQKILSGYSEVTSISADGEGCGVFKDYISINAASESKNKKIAQLMIKYALSEEGQNILCVRNQGMLPLNKKTFDTYTEINSSMSFLDLDKVTILN